ncbi:MAG: hypothetical protein BRD50_06160 [Bacteroidetes bacterium SW_11_45_7]|nr:MAG: hypothetical protein BRD50_06160 [Bacteroidetes bacterium SW_11_45_7]
MSNVKEKRIERIQASRDDELLNELYEMFVSEEQEAIEFTEEQKNKIEESEKQYKKGLTKGYDNL